MKVRDRQSHKQFRQDALVSAYHGFGVDPFRDSKGDQKEAAQTGRGLNMICPPPKQKVL